MHLFAESGALGAASFYTTMVLSLYMREQTQRGGTKHESFSFWWCVYVRRRCFARALTRLCVFEVPHTQLTIVTMVVAAAAMVVAVGATERR